MESQRSSFGENPLRVKVCSTGNVDETRIKEHWLLLAPSPELFF